MPTKLIECACGNTLGQWAAGYFLMMFRKRELLTPPPLSIVCEACGATWRPPEELRHRAARAVEDMEDVLGQVS